MLNRMQLVDRENQIIWGFFIPSIPMKRIYFPKKSKAGEEGLLNRMQLIDTEDLT